MAAVLKGYIAAPVGTEKKMAGLQLVPTSVQNGAPCSRVDELSELSGLIAEHHESAGEEDKDSDIEYHMVQKEEAADMPLNYPRSVGGQGSRSYGATSSPAPVKRRRSFRKRGKRHPRFYSRGSSGFVSPQPLYSLQPHALRQDHPFDGGRLHEQHRAYYSTTALPQEYDRLLVDDETSDDDNDTDNHHSDQSSDEEEEDPPIMELIYRRTCKDKLKLIVIPLLYFLFFVMAGVFAFYSIEALIESYNHRVRTASYVTVENYSPVGIALFPQDFATYENCQFKYGDDLSPSSNWSGLTPNPSDNCSTSVNVTFNSTLIGQNRTAMVFRGPTRVILKQSLWLNFSINTSKREFGAIEFLMVNSWNNFIKMSEKERSAYLALQEAKEPLYTVPAGFRSWVKMYYIIRNDGASKTNLSEFYINTDFSKYNDPRPLENRTTDPLVVLFEWKSPTYEYISDILSTTIWNTLGSLAGVFVTLIKAGEYFYAWIRRIRRERRKKLLKLKELEEEKQRMMEEHERKKEERKKLKQLAASNSQENPKIN